MQVRSRSVAGFAVDSDCVGSNTGARRRHGWSSSTPTELGWQRARCRARAHRLTPADPVLVGLNTLQQWLWQRLQVPTTARQHTHDRQEPAQPEIARTRRSSDHDNDHDSDSQANGHSAAGKLADAEIHFTGGELDGLKLVGFAVWQRRDGQRPERQLPLKTVLRAWGTSELLAPAMDRQAGGARPLGRSRSARRTSNTEGRQERARGNRSRRIGAVWRRKCGCGCDGCSHPLSESMGGRKPCE